MIQHVRAQYPQDKAEQITASFYFICLLHLANEKHLDIEGQADLNDLVIH